MSLGNAGLERYADPGTVRVLDELRGECETVLKLLAQLEVPGLHADQAEDLLGDLSAAVLHLHEHTRGLDERIDAAGPSAG